MSHWTCYFANKTIPESCMSIQVLHISTPRLKPKRKCSMHYFSMSALSSSPVAAVRWTLRNGKKDIHLFNLFRVRSLIHCNSISYCGMLFRLQSSSQVGKLDSVVKTLHFLRHSNFAVATTYLSTPYSYRKHNYGHC